MTAGSSLIRAAVSVGVIATDSRAQRSVAPPSEPLALTVEFVRREDLVLRLEDLASLEVHPAVLFPLTYDRDEGGGWGA